MKLLIVVDMQKDFIDGSLGTSEARQIVDRVAAKIAAYDPACVFATRDTHAPDYLTSCEGRHLPVVHCVAGTPGHALHPAIASALAKMPSDHLIDKPTFGSMDLAQRLRPLAEEGPLEVELVGLCTGICVLSNAILLKAAFSEAEISVDAACCACVTPQSPDTALAAMKLCQIAVENEGQEPWRA